jgi:hypothetical protein
MDILTVCAMAASMFEDWDNELAASKVDWMEICLAEKKGFSSAGR